MNFSLYIAKRYLFSKSGTNAINIITLIAGFSVIVGAAALFVVLSGFSGLRTFSDSLLEASDPDIKIMPAKGKTFKLAKVKSALQSYKDIAAFSEIIEERVSLKYGDKNHIAYIKGVGKNYNHIVHIDSSITMGVWLDSVYKNTSVIGSGISYKLSIGTSSAGEPLQILVPKPGKGFITNVNNAFNSENVHVVGVYSGSEEFQNKFVFTDISVARRLLNYQENEVTAIEIRLLDAKKSNDVRDALSKIIGKEFDVKTKKQLNALYYKVVNTENFISYLIFTLIVVIALFNVIGSIIMMIIDKRKNLKTLLSLGSSVQDIKRIFVYQGFLLVLIGMTIGLVLGVTLIYVQLKTGYFKISYNLPYPVELRWVNLGIVIITIVALGFLASKVASSRISRSFIEK